MTSLHESSREGILDPESARVRLKERALERGRRRSDDVRERVRLAMSAIEKEMHDNEGIYPHNKGALSAAEVARRAHVHPTTLCSPKQRLLGAEVRQWLEVLKSSKGIGEGRGRRELATRIEDWRRLYDGLAQSHRDTELELQQVQAELAQALADLEKALRLNERLQKLLYEISGEKVIPLSTHTP